MKKRFGALFLIAIMGLVFAQEAPKNLQVFPKDSSRREIVNIMRGWSGDLGVRCDFCHWSPTKKFEDMQFDSDKKETKKTARNMYKMMTKINETFFVESETKIGCYTCHHGTSDPRKLDDILAEAMQSGGMTEVDTTYREIRKKFHGGGSYNFRPWAGLNAVAARVTAKGKLEEARQLHELNLEFNPGYDGSHFALGVYYIRVSPDDLKARHHFAKAMQGNSYWTPRNLLRQGLQLKKSGNASQSKQSLAILTEIAPKFAPGHFEWGKLLANSGDKAGAKAAFEKVLALNPEHKQAREALNHL